MNEDLSSSVRTKEDARHFNNEIIVVFSLPLLTFVATNLKLNILSDCELRDVPSWISTTLQ